MKLLKPFLMSKARTYTRYDTQVQRRHWSRQKKLKNESNISDQTFLSLDRNLFWPSLMAWILLLRHQSIIVLTAQTTLTTYRRIIKAHLLSVVIHQICLRHTLKSSLQSTLISIQQSWVMAIFRLRWAEYNKTLLTMAALQIAVVMLIPTITVPFWMIVRP